MLDGLCKLAEGCLQAGAVRFGVDLRVEEGRLFQHPLREHGCGGPGAHGLAIGQPVVDADLVVELLGFLGLLDHPRGQVVEMSVYNCEA